MRRSSVRLLRSTAPPTQVDIDVTIAEVTLNKDLQYGVQVYLNGGSGLGALTMTNGSQAVTQAAASASGAAGSTGSGIGAVWNSADDIEPGR